MVEHVNPIKSSNDLLWIEKGDKDLTDSAIALKIAAKIISEDQRNIPEIVRKCFEQGSQQEFGPFGVMRILLEVGDILDREHPSHDLGDLLKLSCNEYYQRINAHRLEIEFISAQASILPEQEMFSAAVLPWLSPEDKLEDASVTVAKVVDRVVDEKISKNEIPSFLSTFLSDAEKAGFDQREALRILLHAANDIQASSNYAFRHELFSEVMKVIRGSIFSAINEQPSVKNDTEQSSSPLQTKQTVVFSITDLQTHSPVSSWKSNVVLGISASLKGALAGFTAFALLSRFEDPGALLYGSLISLMEIIAAAGAEHSMFERFVGGRAGRSIDWLAKTAVPRASASILGMGIANEIVPYYIPVDTSTFTQTLAQLFSSVVGLTAPYGVEWMVRKIWSRSFKREDS